MRQGIERVLHVLFIKQYFVIIVNCETNCKNYAKKKRIPKKQQESNHRFILPVKIDSC